MKRRVGLIIFLFTGVFVSAQNQFTDNLQLQFRNYQINNVQEKLFVHLDKTFYLAGETIWFKIYATDASFHKPMVSGSITYIEILSKELKPVVQSKVSMLNGSGNGSVTLPGFLSTGNYIFRAYTSWMKNFSPDFYFEQPIHIVNTLKLSNVLPPAKSSATIPSIAEIWASFGSGIMVNFPPLSFLIKQD